MKLQILIPTYNRDLYLIDNLKYISNIIRDNALSSKVGLLIANNCSTDKTNELIESFISDNSDINLEYYSQSENIGLERNAIFCLENASSDYIMYLGDDDYFPDKYLVKVVDIIEGDKSLSCIAPSNYPVTTERKRLEGGRDLDVKSIKMEGSLDTSLYFSWRGHQLSGLVFKREGLVESYKENNVSNIYPFIYFTSYASLSGNSYHLTDYPIEIIVPGQSNKDWGYGSDSLLDEIFNNYKNLPNTSYLKRVKYEVMTLNSQRWRVIRPIMSHPLSFIKKIATSKNTTLFTKFYYNYFIIKLIVRKVFKVGTNFKF